MDHPWRSKLIAKSIQQALAILTCVTIPNLDVALFLNTALAQYSTIINVPPDTAPYEIGSSTQLNVDAGGTIDHHFKAGADDGSSSDVQVNITGGNVLSVTANSGSEINVSDGSFGSVFRATSGSKVNISGATFDHFFRADSGSEVNIGGGVFRSDFYANSGSRVRISGGFFGPEFNVLPNSDTALVGGDFSLNGAEYSENSISLNPGEVLSGTFADGSVFIFAAPIENRNVVRTPDAMIAGVDLVAALLPPIDTAPIEIDAAYLLGPVGLRTGQSLILREGGLLADQLTAIGASLTIEGGTAGAIETVSTDTNIINGTISRFYGRFGSAVTIAGGTIDRFAAFDGSDVYLTDGEVINFDAEKGSVVNVGGGIVGRLIGLPDSQVGIDGGRIEKLWIFPNAQVNVSGGVFDDFSISAGSEVNISGGRFGNNIRSFDGDKLTLIGGEFRLNGIDYAEPTVNLSPDDHFTATLADGSVIVLGESFRSTESIALKSVALPPIDTAPIIVDAVKPIGPFSLRAGQSLTLREGGALGDNFAAIDAALSIEGGAVGDSLIVVKGVVDIQGGEIGADFHTVSDVQVKISGGTIGDGYRASGSKVSIEGGAIGRNFFVSSGAEVNVTDGTISFDFRADDAIVNISGGRVRHDVVANASVFHITGGQVENSFQANAGSVINISGGRIGAFFEANSGSQVNITGGTIAIGFTANGGAVNISGGTFGERFDARRNVTLVGGEFLLNGEVYDETSISLEPGDIFTGTLSDGSPFLLSPDAVDRITNLQLARVELPLADQTPIVVDAATPSAPVGLRSGQVLTVRDGGALNGNFAAIDSTLNVEGGTVGRSFEAARSEINVSGGVVGIFSSAFGGSEVNVTGGTVGWNFSAYNGSQIKISGGVIESSFTARSGSNVTITGGTVGDFFDVFSDSKVSISGGTFGRGFHAYTGSEVRISGGTFGPQFESESDSDLELVGGEFRLNGIPFAESSVSPQLGDVFSGVLADGSVFIFHNDRPEYCCFDMILKQYDTLEHAELTHVELPPVDATPIVLDGAPVATPTGLRAGQVLTLRDGGTLGNNFSAVDAIVHVEGGTVGTHMQVVQSEVNIRSGTIGNDFMALVGSTINLSGGSIGERFSAFSGSEVNISGGTVGREFDAYYGSSVSISGGDISGPAARAGSTVSIAGIAFSLDDEPLHELTVGETRRITERAGILSGILADGSVFEFGLLGFDQNAVLQVTLVQLVPEPSLSTSLVAAVLAMMWRRRQLG